jgi:RNA polymerase sigma factor (sigma-70 family)
MPSGGCPAAAPLSDRQQPRQRIGWHLIPTPPRDQKRLSRYVARHLVYNEHRASVRRDRLLARVAREPRADDASNEGPANASAGIDTTRVTAALAQLSEQDREVLILTTWDGLDRARAAAVLGCSHGALAVRLHRARRRLARALGELPTDTEESP